MNTNKLPRGFTTAILHSDRDGGIEHGALHKPLHVSVAYGYRDARDLAADAQVIARRVRRARRVHTRRACGLGVERRAEQKTRAQSKKQA